MSDYGLIIQNSSGVTIIDSRKRCMEAVAWGSLSIPNRGLARLSLPANITAPMVFIRKPASGTVHIVRGIELSDAAGRYINFSAEGNVTVDYVVGAFRTNVPSSATTGYGLNTFDGNGRLGFSVNHAHMRFSYGKISLSYASSPGPSQFAEFVAGSAISAWGANDYLYWNPLTFWSKDSGANWYTGLWFGAAVVTTGILYNNVIAVRRVDISRSLEAGLLGTIVGSEPGTANMIPSGLLACNFTPPS